AVLLTYGRLNMDNELTVLRASGMSFWSMTAPVRFFGTACFLIALIFSFYVAPMSSVRLKEAVSGIIIQRAPYAIEEGAFNTAFPGLVVYVGGKPSKDALSGIFIYDERDSARPRMLFARTGKISGGEGYPVFHLSDGFMHITKGDISTELFFDRYSFSIPLALKEQGRKKSEYTPFELLREAVTADKTARQYKLMLLLEFHRRLTFPLMCLIIPFIAPPLSLIAGKAGRFGGFTIGLVVFALYYTALVYGERLAVSGTIPHYLGAWLPVALLSVVSFIAFRKAGSK
ncbi:MAG: LptF/LptG family permease, partial [Thermodesulfovibrionales bacterium]|nr:LptF/LptG family permease [Thermodesulfovibrionales bacterium]